MADELVDLVNEQDKVIGVAAKQEAHEKRLLHRIAAVLVFYQDKLVVQKRTAGKNGKFAESVGGHVASGETYEAAAIREGQEEMGLSLNPFYLGKAFGRAKPATDGVERVSHCYGVFKAVISEEQFRAIKPDAREVGSFVLMSIDELHTQAAAYPELFTMGLLRAVELLNKR